jgi:hypothetical protein
VHRVKAAGKPAVLAYLSDLDPGGQSMPVAAARKIEFLVRTLAADLDIKLTHVLLSREQAIEQYRLPPSPHKPLERRAQAFEERQQVGGSIELDALQALHPGEIERLVRAVFDHYFDPSLAKRTEDAKGELQEALDDAERTVQDEFAEEIAAREEAWTALQEQVRELVKPERAAIEDLFTRYQKRLEEVSPDLDDFPLPEAEVDGDGPWALYDTSRPYLEQIDCYKTFQRKAPTRVKAGQATKNRVLALAAAHPDWSPAELAKALGLSKRHVNRVLQQAHSEEGG